MTCFTTSPLRLLILLIVLVSVIVLQSAVQWISVISGRKQAATQEAPFVATAYAEEAQ